MVRVGDEGWGLVRVGDKGDDRMEHDRVWDLVIRLQGLMAAEWRRQSKARCTYVYMDSVMSRL